MPPTLRHSQQAASDERSVTGKKAWPATRESLNEGNESSAPMVNHTSTHTTQLYDRRRDEMSLAEVERIAV